MQRLRAHIRPRGELGVRDVRDMHSLYASYYDASSAEQFAKDLAAKDWVIELREGAALRGFTTLAATDFAAAGAKRRAIYSGDTIIHHRYWGDQALATAFCRFAGALKSSDPGTPLYWFLITKGHRTYRYLGAFSHRYFPNPYGATPAEAQTCLDALARARFGAAYLGARGIVHYEESRGHLKPEWATIRPALLARPEVRFFLERNPRHSQGDELCCLAELAAENLRSYARRAFVAGLDDSSPVSIDRGMCPALPQLSSAGASDPARAAALDSRA